MFEHHTRFRVRYAETDQMGIAHHSHYIDWFEMGRIDFLRAIGYSYADLEKRGVRLAVVEAHCRYRSPARFDELLTVTTRLNQLKKFKLDFHYVIHGESNQLICEGSIVLGSLGSDLKPALLPDDVAEKLQSTL